VPVKRATPRNPRAVLGNATFEDMTRMLAVGKLGERQPPAKVSKKSDDVENMVRFQVPYLDLFWTLARVFVSRKLFLLEGVVSCTSRITVYGSVQIVLPKL
jgi:hypothetical protein